TVIDPLLSAEPAKEALDLYYANRGKKPVVGVGFSPTPPVPQRGPRRGGYPTVINNLQQKKKTPAGFNKNSGLQKKKSPKPKTPPGLKNKKKKKNTKKKKN
ncbi:hypothetical protein ACVGXX_18965, partial [Enterobacter intestinihominis]